MRFARSGRSPANATTATSPPASDDAEASTRIGDEYPDEAGSEADDGSAREREQGCDEDHADQHERECSPGAALSRQPERERERRREDEADVAGIAEREARGRVVAREEALRPQGRR